jgi:hypothetical protein
VQVAHFFEHGAQTHDDHIRGNAFRWRAAVAARTYVRIRS